MCRPDWRLEYTSNSCNNYFLHPQISLFTTGQNWHIVILSIGTPSLVPINGR